MLSGTFTEIRTDTLAILLRYPSVYFSFGRRLVRDALSAVDNIDTSTIETIVSSVDAINVATSNVTNFYKWREHLTTTSVVNRLSDHVGEEEGVRRGDALLSGAYHVDIFTPVTKTKFAPFKVTDVLNSVLSQSGNVTNIVGDTSEPNYVSAGYMADLMGGAEQYIELARGGSLVSMLQWVGTSSPPYNLKFSDAEGQHTHEVLSTSNNQYPFLQVGFTSNKFKGWLASMRYVTFSQRVDGHGSIFSEDAKKVATTAPDSVNVHDIHETSGATVVRSNGGHVTFDRPIFVQELHKFILGCMIPWSRYVHTHSLVSVDLSTPLSNEVIATQAKLTVIRRNLTDLLLSICTVTPTASKITHEIREAHSDVHADHAYLLLTQGDIAEYTSLDDISASSMRLFATAHTRAVEGSTL
jgi:hypothetical protein